MTRRLMAKSEGSDVALASSSSRPPPLSHNEKILNECHRLYTDKVHGLVQMGKSVGLQVMAPQKKIIVMLMGNHSAGKSSFINWYIEQIVQKTGVAIETQGFTFVTAGKKRETLTGKATLHLYPHFKSLERIKNVTDYVSTEIVSSVAKKFNLVTFIDTPGLVDGEMSYPYDVDKAIVWLGNLADQILVFFDPIGQALCRRTINLVEKLNDKHSEKIQFFLSKADEAGNGVDRQKVMMQIVQELCKRPGLNKCGFDMPTIYIPNHELLRPKVDCPNQIDTVCEKIEKTINYTIQNTLNSLDKDCDQVTELILSKIEDDNHKRKVNLGAAVRGLLWLLVSLILPLMVMVTFVSSHLPRLLGPKVAATIFPYVTSIQAAWEYMSSGNKLYAYCFVIVSTLVLLLVARAQSRTIPCLSRKEKKELMDNKDYIRDVLKPKKTELYTSYLSEIVSDDMDL